MMMSLQPLLSLISPQITLDTNHPAVALPSLFQDLQVNEREGEGPQNALGLKLLSGPVVTLVASKSSERYRLQSDSFPAIAVLLGEVVERLELYHDGKVCVSITVVSTYRRLFSLCCLRPLCSR